MFIGHKMRTGSKVSPCVSSHSHPARHSMFGQSHSTSYDTNPDVKRPMLTVRVHFNRFSAFVRLGVEAHTASLIGPCKPHRWLWFCTGRQACCGLSLTCWTATPPRFQGTRRVIRQARHRSHQVQRVLQLHNLMVKCLHLQRLRCHPRLRLHQLSQWVSHLRTLMCLQQPGLLN